MSRRVALAAVLVSVSTLSGCGVSDERLLAERGRLLLASEPADALPVLEARELPPSAEAVVVVGQIGGVPDPWGAGQATFVIADPSVLAEMTGHHDDGKPCGCPFCQKKESDPTGLAVVEFRGPDGKLLAIDPRKLFDLDARETVVVRGRTRIDESGYLLIAADGIYVRR